MTTKRRIAKISRLVLIKGKAFCRRFKRRVIPLLRKKVVTRVPVWLIIVFAAWLTWAIASVLAPRPVIYQFNPTSFSALPPTPGEEGSEFSSDFLYATPGYYGGCNAYVASRMLIPIGWGDAKDWDDNARESGWLVDRTPKIGSIAQDNIGWQGRGHTAYIEDIEGDRIYVSERGAGFKLAPGEIHYRWTTVDDWSWFLHPNGGEN